MASTSRLRKREGFKWVFLFQLPLICAILSVFGDFAAQRRSAIQSSGPSLAERVYTSKQSSVFVQDIYRRLGAQQARGGLLRLRTSRGYRVSNALGNIFPDGDTPSPVMYWRLNRQNCTRSSHKRKQNACLHH